MQDKKIKLSKAESKTDIESASTLFLEYAKSLNFDLCFQGFNEELQNLPGDYSSPGGEILLAFYDEKLAGCVALRNFNEGISEMKRMYVRPEFRGKKIARLLAEKIIDDAKKMNYAKMRLDTIGTMKEAIALYVDLGFREIKSYRFNPLSNVLYMELNLLSEK